MPSTDTYFVSKKTNKVLYTAQPKSFFDSTSKQFGKAKYIISVFGYNTEETARKVRDMVDAAGMSDKLFTISVSTK